MLFCDPFRSCCSVLLWRVLCQVKCLVIKLLTWLSLLNRRYLVSVNYIFKVFWIWFWYDTGILKAHSIILSIQTNFFLPWKLVTVTCLWHNRTLVGLKLFLCCLLCCYTFLFFCPCKLITFPCWCHTWKLVGSILIYVVYIIHIAGQLTLLPWKLLSVACCYHNHDAYYVQTACLKHFTVFDVDMSQWINLSSGGPNRQWFINISTQVLVRWTWRIKHIKYVKGLCFFRRNFFSFYYYLSLSEIHWTR